MGNALSGYERGVERFCEQLARVGLGFWSGRAPRADAAAVYRRNRALLGPAAIEALQARVSAAADGSASEQAGRDRRLLEFALTESANAGRLPFDARVAVAERSVPVRAAGRPVPLAGVATALADEPDAGLRRLLESGRSRVLGEHVDAELIAARDEALAVGREAGYATRAEAFAAAAGFSLEALAGQCRGLLDRSAPELAEASALLAARAGLGDGSGLGIADFPRLLSAGADRNSDALAGSGPSGLLATLCAGLGLPQPGQSGIHVDLQPRAGKSARGFCVAVRVPGAVHLVVDPASPAATEALLHEAGHALHRAHTDPALDVGSRRLGDNGVTESWAFLIEGLAAGSRSPEAGAAERARRLLLVRRHCARLIYELELDRGWEVARESMPGRYAALLSEATGAEWSRGGWLYDLDPGFYSARYVRGWMLAAEWRRELTARFGPEWPLSPAAGDWLRGKWRLGQSLDAAALCEAALGRELGPGALELELSAPAASRSPR